MDHTNIYQLRRGRRFQWEPVQGCHVILYPEGMVKLSASAGAILEQVDGQQNVSDIIHTLYQHYPQAEPSELVRDVEAFLAEAYDNGWLHLREEKHHVR